MLFDRQWFQKHQNKLLLFANTSIGRKILCIDGDKSEVGKNRILKIEPNAITWGEGNCYKTEFRATAKFSKRIYYAFKPVWSLAHIWDTEFANFYLPDFNLGFDTLTQYPGTISATNPADGFVRREGVSESFATIRAGAGNGAYPDNLINVVSLEASDVTDEYNTLGRIILCFDTSTLTTYAHVTGTTVSLYGWGTAKSDALGTADLHIGSATPASTSNLVNADYNSVGTTSFGSIAYADYTTDYNVVTLNASGIANLVKTGISSYSAQLSWDINNDATGLVWASELVSRFYSYGSEQTGTANDPKLVVTYHLDFNPVPEDSITITDSMSKVSGFKLALTDSISITETVQPARVLAPLNLTDSMSVSESTVRSKGFGSALTDSMSVSESLSTFSAHGNLLPLSDSMTIASPILEISLVSVPTLKTDWRLFIRTPAGAVVASLTNARGRWFKETLNDGGSAGFILDASDTNCTSTILATNQNELIIEYKGYEMWGGQISTIKKIANGNDIYWEVTAKQFFNLLELRYCGYNKSTGLSDPKEFTTTDAGTIAWTLINESQTEVNGSFGITMGIIQTSLNRTKKYERANIADSIRELANNDYGFDFEITPSKVFNVFYPLKGTIKDNVVFRYPGNCSYMESTENGWDVVNHELGLGRNWGGQETYYVVDDVTSELAYKRREKIASYKDVEVQSFLNDMVTEDVSWNKDINKVVKFKSFIDSKTELYMYELGDSVRVVSDPLGLNESLFVYEREIHIDDSDQVTVNLTLGD